MFNDKFYWSTIRKSVVAFGNMFNNIHIDRKDSTGAVVQTIKVPLPYAPKQKFLSRIAAQPQSFEQSFESYLPRMSFELLGIQYDPSRRVGLLQQNPNAQGMQAAMMAHINEHLGYEYKKQIEAQIGMQIPDYEDEQTIPEDMETQIAQRAAQASQKLLQQHQMEAQQQQAQQQMQDPIIQMQMQELQIKQAEVQRKIAKDQADSMAKDKQMQVEMARIDAQKEIAGANMAMKHVADSRRDAKDEKL